MAEKQRELFAGYAEGALDRPTVCSEKSMTRQSDLEGSDINVIMKRYEKTGVLPLETRQALFQDVSGIGSYQDARNLMIVAEEAFYALSPAIREKFGNDPVAFLDFTSDPANLRELEAMGVLATPEAEVAPKAPEEPAEPAGAQ